MKVLEQNIEVGHDIQPFSEEALFVWQLVQENLLLVGPQIQPFTEEYLNFVVEVEMYEKLKQQCWILQDEIDDLQVKILSEIYGQGGTGN